MAGSRFVYLQWVVIITVAIGIASHCMVLLLTRPIQYIVAVGDKGAVQEYLSSGGNPDAEMPNQAVLVSIAIENRQADIALLLLENGADPNVIDGDGHTPLHYAIDIGDPILTKALLGKGADPHLARGSSRMTPFGEALYNADQKIVKQFLDADVAPTDEEMEFARDPAIKRLVK